MVKKDTLFVVLVATTVNTALAFLIFYKVGSILEKLEEYECDEDDDELDLEAESKAKPNKK